ETLSDLAGVADQLTAGVVFEFANRADGLAGLTRAYNFKFKNSLTLDGGPRYVALENGEIDVIDAFATDGLLKKFNLRTLVDDKKFFPPYYAIPIVRTETYEKYPEIAEVIQRLNTVLSDEVMMELNYKVDELQQEPKLVARDFLEEKSLI
ncbi:glycine betaine ABC transporter substrate-binding protein, partial [Aminipila sp.]|uniref:glycine betaine ABC transporter substrate-binding protein n=1 Tax=Aminipila sp. TaxID=2060095 RepID=UPI002896A986